MVLLHKDPCRFRVIFFRFLGCAKLQKCLLLPSLLFQVFLRVGASSHSEGTLFHKTLAGDSFYLVILDKRDFFRAALFFFITPFLAALSMVAKAELSIFFASALSVLASFSIFLII